MNSVSSPGQSSTPMSAGIGGLVGQEKMWKDLTVEEKVERMRNVVKGFENYVVELPNKFENLKNDFQNHAHVGDKVVKDVKTYNNNLGSLSANRLNNWKDEQEGNVYF